MHARRPVAAVAFAWLRARATVVAPIASVRTVEQLTDLTPMVELALSVDESNSINNMTMGTTVRGLREDGR